MHTAPTKQRLLEHGMALLLRHGYHDLGIAAHMENPVISARFLPYLDTPGRIDAIKGHVCTFLESGSGGTRNYTGRPMRDAHRGMNISDAEFIAAVDDILLVLRKHGVDDTTQKDVLAIAYSLKNDIVHV